MPGSIGLYLQHNRGDRDNSGSYRATACQRIRRAGSASCVGVGSAKERPLRRRGRETAMNEYAALDEEMQSCRKWAEVGRTIELHGGLSLFRATRSLGTRTRVDSHLSGPRPRPPLSPLYTDSVS